MATTEVKERPILFNGEMVRAIRDGRKTETRRPVEPKPPRDECGDHVYGSLCGPEWYEPIVVGRDGEEREGKPVFGVYSDDGEWGCKCPYEPGMRLWVRETFCKYGSVYIYRADYGTCTPISDGIGGPWKPSIHMPRRASRLSVEIVDIRIELAHKITDAAVRAEGTPPEHIEKWRKYLHPNDVHGHAFGERWDAIYEKKYPWRSNPWVWVYKFTPASPPGPQE